MVFTAGAVWTPRVGALTFKCWVIIRCISPHFPEPCTRSKLRENLLTKCFRATANLCLRLGAPERSSCAELLGGRLGAAEGRPGSASASAGFAFKSKATSCVIGLSSLLACIQVQPGPGATTMNAIYSPPLSCAFPLCPWDAHTATSSCPLTSRHPAVTLLLLPSHGEPGDLLL